MATDVYNSKPLVLAAFPGTGVIPGRIQIGGWKPQACLILAADYDQNALCSFQPSGENDIYLYVSGDRMGEVVVRGTAFPARCETGVSAESNKGLVELLEFYQGKRLAENPEPIMVDISTKVLRGFLTGLRVTGRGQADEPNSFVSDFALTVKLPPEAGPPASGSGIEDQSSAETADDGSGDLAAFGGESEFGARN